MKADVIVIGAGVIGAAIAWNLSRAGRSVLVLDRAGPAAGASGRSFGWINASFHLSPAHYRLRLAAMEDHRRLAAELPETETTWPGALSWDFGADGIDATEAALRDLGYPLRRLDRAAVAALEPALSPPGDEALLFPAEGVCDLARLTRALLNGAAAHGARFGWGLAADALLTSGRVIAGVRTVLGDFAAPQVVVAAGCGAAALLSDLDFTLPMLQRPAALFRTRALPLLLRHIIVTPSLEFRQEPDGRILAPAAASHQSDDASGVEGPLDALAASVLARLGRALPDVTLNWEEAGLAYRPVPGDGAPVVGPAGPEGLYVAVLHSGATLAPLIGRLAAAELTGAAPGPLLAPFRPGRFG